MLVGQAHWSEPAAAELEIAAPLSEKKGAALPSGGMVPRLFAPSKYGKSDFDFLSNRATRCDLVHESAYMQSACMYSCVCRQQ